MQLKIFEIQFWYFRPVVVLMVGWLSPKSWSFRQISDSLRGKFTTNIGTQIMWVKRRQAFKRLSKASLYLRSHTQNRKLIICSSSKHHCEPNNKAMICIHWKNMIWTHSMPLLNNWGMWKITLGSSLKIWR